MKIVYEGQEIYDLENHLASHVFLTNYSNNASIICGLDRINSNGDIECPMMPTHIYKLKGGIEIFICFCREGQFLKMKKRIDDHLLIEHWIRPDLREEYILCQIEG
jgi:hypothetical protein